MQYDNFPSNYDPSDLCIKIIYEVRHTRFGWVSVDCENQTAKAGTCCNQGLLIEGKQTFIESVADTQIDCI